VSAERTIVSRSGAVDEPGPSPRFSIIVPLESHRGQAVRCLRAWAAEQLFPREQFELVVASPPGYPRGELDEIRRLLGPQDRILELAHEHDMELCAVAAEAARGELLFFTESHCLPEPETLAAADDVARLHPDWAGFSCRSVPITHNLLSKVEAETYGRDIEFGMTQHPWRKVLDQCFVVRTSAYFQAGGFDATFGHFAEWLIAARFHALGLTIGYAPDVRIHHVYIGKLGEWRRFTADFVEGQMRYLALEPGDPLGAMFDEVPEWTGRHNLEREAARRVCRMLLADLRDSGASGGRGRRLSALRRWHWRVLRSWLVRAVAGDTNVLIRAQLRHFSARLGLQLDLLRRDRARAEEHFARCCAAIATVERTRFLRRRSRDLGRNATGRPPPGAESLGRAGRWAPGRLDEVHGVGFHASSGNGAEAIRWSEPAAYVELPLAPGAYGIGLNLLFPPPVRGEQQLRFYLDEKPVPSENVRIHDDQVELRIDIPESSSVTRLGWVCAAHRAEGDHRALGLPVVSLTWAPAEAGASAFSRRPERSNPSPKPRSSPLNARERREAVQLRGSTVQSSSGRTTPRHCPVNVPRDESPSSGSWTWNDAAS
jgi:hypothetical protein